MPLLAVWNQQYTPVASNLLLSALVAALPVIVLLGLLGLFHVKAHLAALAGLATVLVIAIAIWGMPVGKALTAAAYGAGFGIFPIGYIVFTAIFLYDITVATGQFEVVKDTIAGLASDRRIQLLLIAFSFGAFIEGSAGFGTPVAISAAMLIGLGFRPLHAAGLALIGNTAPVAFGAIGTPVITLADVTKLDLHTLSAMIGRQLPFFSLIVPFWLVWAMAGRRATLQVWPACLVAGGSFALAQFLVSNLHGPWLVDIVASLFSIGCTLVLLRFWQPATIWRFEHERVEAPGSGPGAMRAGDAEAGVPAPRRHDRRAALRAWTPWILLSLFVFLWGLPQVKTFLGDVWSTVAPKTVNVAGLHKEINRMPPVVAKPSPVTAAFDVNPLAATGTGLLLAAVLSGLYLRMGVGGLARQFVRTLNRVKISLLTIAAMLAIAYTSRYAGLDASMGLAFARTGALFAFFSPLLGWLGVALTGSDTSSNALFGNLQTITAQQTGMSPVLAASANSSGGVMGKMIDAQSIVVAGVATGQQGDEGDILRYVFFHSIALAALVGVLVFLQSTVLSWMVPG